MSPIPAILRSHRRHDRRRGAFTLAEMLVIIGIILLVMAIALPAFTIIIGSRSIESARNIVAASIVRARGEAIRRGQPCGVFFYVDPDSGRTGVALVTLDPLTDPDPYTEYQLFTRAVSRESYRPQGLPSVLRDYQGGSYDPLNATTDPPDPAEDEPSMTADRVVVLGADVNGFYGPRPSGLDYSDFQNRPIIIVTTHTSADIRGAPNPGVLSRGDETFTPEPLNTGQVHSGTGDWFDNPHWASPLSEAEIGTLELIDGIKTELLAKGVGLQVILGRALENTTDDGAADADGFKYAIPGPGATAPDPDDPEFLERYARSGLILFNAEGHLIQASYRIYTNSRLGRVIGLELVPDPSNTAQPIEEYVVTLGAPALGVALYDRGAFDNAASTGTALVWKGGHVASLVDPTTPFDEFVTSDGDVTFLYPPADRPIGITQPPPAGDWRFHEYAEERWLDANTIPLMVNRYSGTIVEAE